ncbi:UNVERIFIED_ORG: hypothetical protein M2328_003528 [Rhodococcus erythropolis]
MTNDYEAFVDAAIRDARGPEFRADAHFDPEHAAIRNGSNRTTSDRLVPGGTFLFDEPAHVPAVWGSGDSILWPEGEGLMLAGQQGLGKTTIAQQLVLHRIGVRPGPFLEQPVPVVERPVLYLAMDRPRQVARSMRRMVDPEHRGVLDDLVRFWKGPLPVNPLEQSSAFADWMQSVVPDVSLVVVDSVKDLAPGISDDKVGAGLNSAWQEVIARGVELLLLHHERKAGQGAKREVRLASMYGSTWLTSGLGSVIGLEGEPGDDLVTLHHLKQPVETVGPLRVQHSHLDGVTTIHGGARSVLDVLQSAGDSGATAAEIADAVCGKSDDATRKRVQRQLDRMANVAALPGGQNPDGRGTLPKQYRLIGPS